MKAFLYCASRIVRANDGTITNFDGDRVMAVFVGGSKNSNAGRVALKINYAVKEIVRPKAEKKFPSIASKGFVISHASGADTGKVLAVRAGMRGANDLIWIGRPPGLAAKLSSVREDPYRSFITADVYGLLANDVKHTDGKAMWQVRAGTVGGQTIYRSSWHWKP
jgi:class 3 adenylate cyclase